MPRVHTISYPVAQKDLEHPLKPFMLRDLCAACELLQVLHEMGFSQGEPIFQPPPPKGAVLPPSRPYPLDSSFVEPDDVLVLTTRPPMNDVQAGRRKKIQRSYTDLEELTFMALRRFLSYCARTRIELEHGMHRHLGQGFEDRREMEFFQNGTFAPYRSLNAHDGRGGHRPAGPARTPVFLLVLEKAWKDGPGFLCAFGMDGCATQVWCYLLARRFARLLRTPGFYIAEMEIGKMPERVTDLRWSLDWTVEFVLEHELTGPRSAVA